MSYYFSNVQRKEQRSIPHTLFRFQSQRTMNEAELTMYAFVVLLSLFSTTYFVTAAQFGHPNVRHRVIQYHNQKQKQQLKTSSNLKNDVLLLHSHMSLIPSLSPSINYDSSYIQNKHYYPSDYTTTAASDFSNPPSSASETLLNIRLVGVYSYIFCVRVRRMEYYNYEYLF